MRIDKIFTKLNFLNWNNPIKKLKRKKNKFIVNEIDLYEYKKIYEKLNLQIFLIYKHQAITLTKIIHII